MKVLSEIRRAPELRRAPDTELTELRIDIDLNILLVLFTFFVGVSVLNFIKTWVSKSITGERSTSNTNVNVEANESEFDKSVGDIKVMVVKKKVLVEHEKEELRVSQIVQAIDQILVQVNKKKVCVSENEISKLEAAIRNLENQHVQRVNQQFLSRDYFILRMTEFSDEIRHLQQIVNQGLAATLETTVVIEDDRNMRLITTALERAEEQIKAIITQTHAETQENLLEDRKCSNKGDGQMRKIIFNDVETRLQSILKMSKQV